MVIKHVKGQTRKRRSGIEVPTELSDRFIRGEIISVSETGKEEFGLDSGQEVLYDKHAGHEVKGVDGEDYKVITCRDIAVTL